MTETVDVVVVIVLPLAVHAPEAFSVPPIETVPAEVVNKFAPEIVVVPLVVSEPELLKLTVPANVEVFCAAEKLPPLIAVAPVTDNVEPTPLPPVNVPPV